MRFQLFITAVASSVVLTRAFPAAQLSDPIAMDDVDYDDDNYGETDFLSSTSNLQPAAIAPAAIAAAPLQQCPSPITITKTITMTVTAAAAVQTNKPKKNKNNQGQQQQPQKPKAAKTVAKAVYVNVNDPKCNAVAAIPINADGTLDTAKMTLTETGGLGGIGKTLDAATNQLIDADVDPLFSQGAVTANGNLVFAVNAGSNTLTMFKTSKKNRTNLVMVGKPVDTMGDFPVSVTFSKALKTACVLNGGKRDGIACFKADKNTGLTPLDAVARPLGFGQSTPPVGPLGTASHVLFKPDGSGDPTINKDGFLAAFPVDNLGKVSTQLVKSVPTGSKVLFGSSFAGTSNTLVATDAAFGAVTFQVDGTSLTAGQQVAATTVDGQAATCWAAFSAVSQTTFVTDIKKNRFVEIDPFNNGEIVKQLDVEGIEGMIDLAVGGNFIYSLAPATTTVVVANVSKGRGTASVAQIAPQAGLLKSSMGMAVLF
ncbi:hypothetical protein BC829DRAFT_409181 [Chytridium lagenaria]|nr:hypothetical protein BC829DRAFT_409181 [Chytridium lagenaria]